MNALLPLTLTLAVSSATAADYWHPETDRISIAGPESAVVCQWVDNPGTTTSYVPDQWVCEEVELFGAKVPIEIQLESVGPVKIRGGVKWAYAWDDGQWVPMASFGN